MESKQKLVEDCDVYYRRSVFFSTANDIYLTKFSSLATRRTVESTAEKKITTNKLISPFRTLVIHSLSADHIN